MAKTAEQFHWADYVVFSLVLALSCGIGLFYAFTGGKQKTQQEFLMGNRNMHTLPVSVSIMVSFISAILILGAPAEVYTYGTQYWMYAFGIGLAAVFSCILFVPLLYPLKLTSSYEYLELRFQSKAAKIVGSLLLITSQIIYMGIATYSPATALEGVTGFPVWASIVCIVVVSTFYTTMGGMKAVIWTDVFQTVIMLGGLFAIVIVGCIEVGGISDMWDINEAGGRVEFFDFDPDPTTRQSFWSLIVGGGVSWLATFGVNQASVQRFCSLPTMNKARIALLLTAPGILLLMTLCCLSGMVVYAYYAECDPLTHPDQDQRIGNSNQLIPYFVMQVLGWPGVPGLFVATLFSGALSSMSSSLNAMAAVVWEDLLKWKFYNISEIRKTILTKFIVAIFGLAAMGMAFATEQMGGTVLQASLSFTASATSPILGLFLLGGLFPCANWLGAVIGGIVGLAFPMWISIGQYIVKPYYQPLNTTTENCNVNWSIIDIPETGEPPLYPEDLEGIEKLYTVSYLWFPSIGTATTVFIGLLVSFISSPFIHAPKSHEIDRKYLLPIFDWLCCCLPNKCREPCRCGYESSDYEKEDGAIIMANDENGTLSTINGWYYDNFSQSGVYSCNSFINLAEETTEL